MYSINKVTIEGNLTRDAELKALPSGTNICNMSIATNRKWKDKDGALQEDVQYHNIVVFGKQAESCAKYLTKGSSALVEGRLETRSWETDGAKHYRTEIVAEDVRFGAKPTASKVGNTSVNYPQSQTVDENIAPEDIPFN